MRDKFGYIWDAELETLTPDQLPHLHERRDTILASLFQTLDIAENDQLMLMLGVVEAKIEYLRNNHEIQD